MDHNIILQTKENKKLCFLYDDGVCVRDVTVPGKPQKRIYPEATQEFDVLELENGRKAILCEDREGSIVFLSEDGEDWLKTTLLKSKSGQSSKKQFYLFESGGWLNAFYFLRYQEQLLLVHHILDNEDIEPEVVDLAHEENAAAFCLQNGDFMVLYHSDYSNGNLGYKTYLWSQKEWGRFETIDKGTLFSAAMDSQENIYTVYKQEDAFYLKVLTKDPYKTAYTQKQIPLDFLNTAKKNICIVIDNGKLWILYHNGASMFASYSPLDEIQFSTPQQFVSMGDFSGFCLKNDNVTRSTFGYWNHGMPELLILKEEKKQIQTAPTEIEDFAGIERTTDSLSRQDIDTKRSELEIAALKRDIEMIKKRLISLEKNVVYKEL